MSALARSAAHVAPVVGELVFRQRLTALEQWLWEQGGRALGLGHPPKPEALAQQVLSLSDLYTLQRRQGLDEAAQRQFLVAKVFYYLASDAPKGALVLAELAQRYGARAPWPAGRTLRAIDVGAGVGATAAGLLLSLDSGVVPRVELLALDADPQALAIWQGVAQQAARIAGVELQARTQEHDLAQPFADSTAGWCDLVLAQSVLNELAAAAGGAGADHPRGGQLRANWLASWLERGVVLAIEPGLHETTRPLHAARDLLLSSGQAVVLAPCPHQRPCPMLREARHWCHEVRLVTPPPLVEQVQALTRRRDQRCKFSFVVLCPPGAQPTPATTAAPADAAVAACAGPATHRGRLVSDPLPSKGKVERMFCGSDGQLIRLRLLDRERSTTNELLAEAARGTRVEVGGAPRWPRVDPQATVRAW